MYDLVSYKDQKIAELTEQIKKLTIQNEKYATFIFELLMDDCPKEYKNIVKSEILKENKI